MYCDSRQRRLSRDSPAATTAFHSAKQRRKRACCLPTTPQSKEQAGAALYAAICASYIILTFFCVWLSFGCRLSVVNAHPGIKAPPAAGRVLVHEFTSSQFTRNARPHAQCGMHFPAVVRLSCASASEVASLCENIPEASLLVVLHLACCISLEV